MKVLVACEFSGRVRNAFAKRGHFVVSCDFLPNEDNVVGGSTWGERYHICGDVQDLLNKDFDLMIAHPPCTYLSNAGIGWFNEEKYGDKARQRKQLRLDAFDFVMQLANASVEKICIENPVGWLNSHWKKPNQIIQPYYFGDPESKRTCLWLKNLSILQYTNVVKPKIYAYYKRGKKKGQPIYGNNYMKFSKDRGKIRSITYQGIANAMAEQWG